MWRSSIVPLLLLLSRPGFAEERLLKQEVASRFLNATRIVRIYLPPSYHQEPRCRYPVLYLHDGQNLFSSAGTNICFGWGNWELDKTVDELCRAGRMQEVILVAIDNTASRYEEYRGPAWGEGDMEKDIGSWKLVHFIRHLTSSTADVS